jgi:hypothetical protein
MEVLDADESGDNNSIDHQRNKRKVDDSTLDEQQPTRNELYDRRNNAAINPTILIPITLSTSGSTNTDVSTKADGSCINNVSAIKNDAIPEWAMIELNGELIKPIHDRDDENNNSDLTTNTTNNKSCEGNCSSNINPDRMIDPDMYELGTIQFVNQKVIKLCCYSFHW